VRVRTALSPDWGLSIYPLIPHGLRRGLRSYAASRLNCPRKKSMLRPAAPEGALIFAPFTASLKRCPDTNQVFSAACKRVELGLTASPKFQFSRTHLKPLLAGVVGKPGDLSPVFPSPKPGFAIPSHRTVMPVIAARNYGELPSV